MTLVIDHFSLFITHEHTFIAFDLFYINRHKLNLNKFSSSQLSFIALMEPAAQNPISLLHTGGQIKHYSKWNLIPEGCLLSWLRIIAALIGAPLAQQPNAWGAIKGEAFI